MSKHPQISIAICTFNRADYLKDTLNDLSDQTEPADSFEILVVNNNSSDHTQEVCAEFTAKHPKLNFRLVDEPKQGLSPARNRAFREAEANYILYIDDDVHLPENFSETALRYISDRPNLKAAGGRIFVSFDESNPDWIPRQLMPMFGLHDLGEFDKIYPQDNFPRGGNMLIHKELFEEVGQFDPELGRSGDLLVGSEEKAFFDRARRAGIKLHYLADLKLHHRIGPKRLKREYLRNQSIGIGLSERRRLARQPFKIFGKWCSEIVKLAGSLILAMGHLISGNPKAARFILIFRIWVMKGFLKRR